MASKKQKPLKKAVSLKAKGAFFEKLQTYALILLIGFILADLTSLWVQPFLLPQKAPTPRFYKSKQKSFASRGDYQVIESRNIFNSEGFIPPALSSKSPLNPDLKGPAVRSNLSIELLGTIVHGNPAKSVASVNLKSINKTGSYRAGESMEKLAEVVKIERRKIIFKNNKNGQLEFIEIPNNDKISFGVNAPKLKKKSSTIVQKGKFKFEIKRETLKKYTKDLSSVLNQARMLPHTVGGQIKGFRFVSIKPNSIYSELGFKAGDIIKEVDGEPVNSPTKAMELYSALKNSDKVQLIVERKGKSEEFTYEVR